MALSTRPDPYDLYDTLVDDFMACDPPAPAPAPPAGQPARARKPPRVPSGGAVDLSVFDILNVFRRRWFLSREALLANVLSAQKAEDGLVSWVEFAPPFHSHLVKCALALIPGPVPKVKQCMFVFILELLNREGHLAFFELQKGGRKANHAQKEKRRLARKRSRAAKREREREAAKVANLPARERECVHCGRKFQSRKTASKHRRACPNSKVVRGKEAAAGASDLRPAPPALVAPAPAPVAAPLPPALFTPPTAPALDPAPVADPSHSHVAPPVTGDSGDNSFLFGPPLPAADYEFLASCPASFGPRQDIPHSALPIGQLTLHQVRARLAAIGRSKHASARAKGLERRCLEGRWRVLRGLPQGEEEEPARKRRRQ